MSKENVQKFIEKVNNDQALRQEIEAKMEGVEEMDAIAEQLAAFSEKAGLPFTADEYKRECQKLPEGVLDNVAGGTATEFAEITGLQRELEQRMKEAGEGWWSVNRFQTWTTRLKKVGIEADLSAGFAYTGAGSRNNTYRCMKTGKMILHEEVINFIKTGKKSWL